MKDFNGTKIIAVDHGYGNIKTANTVTPAGITAYDSPPVFSGNILEHGGKYYRIGDGRKEFVPDKCMDGDYYLFTMAGIAKELHRERLTAADVHISAGLPLTWVRRQREDFRAYLMKCPQMDFRFNGTDYRINLVGCSIYPQGYPAIVERLADFKGTNLLADIGNGTMNILYINNKKPVESRSYTEKYGVNQCMIAARNAILDRFGIKIEDSIIEQILRYGTADIGKPYLDCVTQTATAYADNIFATLRRYEYNPELMRLYVVGGGGCLLKHFGDFDRNRVTVIDDICATAKGYEFLAYHALRRKEHP